MRLATTFLLSVSLVQQMDSQSKSSVKIFLWIDYSNFLFHRVNSLTKLLSVCTDQRTSVTQGTKLLSVTEGLNVPIWPLTGSGFIAIPSREKKFKNPTSQMETRS